jgi:hypothetical protein
MAAKDGWDMRIGGASDGAKRVLVRVAIDAWEAIRGERYVSEGFESRVRDETKDACG